MKKKRITAGILCAVLLLCAFFHMPKTNAEPVLTRFFDVNPKSYYTEAVTWAVSHTPQITNGTSVGIFSPDDRCTRAQVLTFLWRSEGCPTPKVPYTKFKDVSAGSYYAPAVAWALEKKITAGTDAYHFSPNETCTRGQIVTFLWRYYSGSTFDGIPNPFKDVADSDYYKNAVIWALRHHITNGTDRTHFSPKQKCSRAETITFLYRAFRNKDDSIDDRLCRLILSGNTTLKPKTNDSVTLRYEYQNFDKVPYTIRVWMFDAKTGKPAGLQAETVFTPSTCRGLAAVTVPLDSTKYRGSLLIPFTEVYDENGELFCELSVVNNGNLKYSITIPAA